MRRRDPFEVLPPKKQRTPFPFVLDELSSLDPFTRPMFGCLAVYVGARIYLILRDKGRADPDNGVWVACEPQHRAAIERELPNLMPIEVFGGKVGGWQKLSAVSPDFEEHVLHACALILASDPRIGKVPGTKRAKKRPAP